MYDSFFNISLLEKNGRENTCEGKTDVEKT